jgi:hypothetical protein
MPRRKASRIFYDLKSRTADQGLARSLKSTFKKKPVRRTGTYLPDGRIQVGGQKYKFHNTSGATLQAGDQLPVINIARPSAAIYAPAEGGGAFPVGGSGSSSSSSQSSAGSGITLDTSGWSGILEGLSGTLQAVLDALDHRALVRHTVDSLTIPDGYTYQVQHPFTVTNAVTIEDGGRLVIT